MKLISLLEKIGFGKYTSKEVDDVVVDKFEDFGVYVGQLYQKFLNKDVSSDPAIAQKIINMVDFGDSSDLSKEIKDLEFLVNQLPDKPGPKDKIGFKEDCTTMNYWKLILIKYILDQEGLECVYNCVGEYNDIDLTDLESGVIRGDCKTLWAQGGPSTGLNHDSAHQGTSGTPPSGEGTTITQYDGFPSGFFGYNGSLSPSSNLTYEGDWITFDLPSSHYLSSPLNGTYWMLTDPGSGGTGLHQGCPNTKHRHYTQCCPYTTFTPIVLEPEVRVR